MGHDEYDHLRESADEAVTHMDPSVVPTPKVAEIRAVEVYGNGLHTDVIDGLVHVSAKDFNGVSISFKNDGLVLMIGTEDGYGPTKVWLTRDGEQVEGGSMSWSTQFQFEVPS